MQDLVKFCLLHALQELWGWDVLSIFEQGLRAVSCITQVASWNVLRPAGLTKLTYLSLELCSAASGMHYLQGALNSAPADGPLLCMPLHSVHAAPGRRAKVPFDMCRQAPSDQKCAVMEHR